MELIAWQAWHFTKLIRAILCKIKWNIKFYGKKSKTTPLNNNNSNSNNNDNDCKWPWEQANRLAPNVCCYHLHLQSQFIIITQPESWKTKFCPNYSGQIIKIIGEWNESIINTCRYVITKHVVNSDHWQVFHKHIVRPLFSSTQYAALHSKLYTEISTALKKFWNRQVKRTEKNNAGRMLICAKMTLQSW